MKRLTGLLVWLITLAMPVFLGFANIRLLISPALLRWEYHKPNFPPDSYGLTREQRIELASVAVAFLDSTDPPDEAIRLLAEQTLDGRPIYNQRELDHMVDTKRLTDIIRYAAWVSGVIVVGGTLWLAWRPQTRPAARQGLLNGAILTAGILGAILLYILLGWRSFFTRFHELLFPAGSWTFAYSETLIRLFPEKFWFDVGVLLTAGTLAGAFLVGVLARWPIRRAGRRLAPGERDQQV